MKIPSYRLHRPSGQAVVTLSGRDVYLGPHGTPESKRRYERAVAEWLAAGRAVRPPPGPSLTVLELLAAYEPYAAAYYSRDGVPTGQIDIVRRGLAVVRRLYGDAPAAAFGPVALQAVRSDMVAAGLSRGVVNQRVGCVKRCWQWAAENELVPAEAWRRLLAVQNLHKGRLGVRDCDPVPPAPEADVAAALACMPPLVADMVRVQLLCGCRPGELCRLTLAEVDARADVWLYRPSRHKTDHLDGERVIYLGPRAQAALAPYLPGDPHPFSPRRSVEIVRGLRRAARKTPVQPSQRDRSKADPDRAPGGRYTRGSYNQAVARACRRAGVPPWHVHQLRHNAATQVAEEFGWDTARLILGHKTLDATRIYGADATAKAVDAMRRAG